MTMRDLLTLFMGGGVATSIVMIGKLFPDLRLTKSQRVKTDAEAEKAGAEAATLISDAALALLAPLREDAAAAHAEVTALRGEVGELRAELLEYHRIYGPLPAT